MNRFFKISLFLVMVAIVTISCGGKRETKEGELSGELSLSGAFALYP